MHLTGTAYGECYGGLSPEVRIPPELFVSSHQHIPDSMIGLTASSKKNNIEFLVSEDSAFRGKMNRNQQVTKAVSLQEFLEIIRTA